MHDGRGRLGRLHGGATSIVSRHGRADFLMSPASRYWLFATQYFPFVIPSSTDWLWCWAPVMGLAGISFGDWRRKTRR